MKFEIAPKETEIEATWDDAKLYCFSLNIGGKTGWRLPSKDELELIHRKYQHDHEYEHTWYWTSENSPHIPTEYYIQYMGSGYLASSDGSFEYLVRAIRDLKETT